MTDVSPTQAQYDEFGRPLHPIAAAIHNSAYANATPAPNATPMAGNISPISASPVTAPAQEPQQMMMPGGQTQPVQQVNKPDFSPIQAGTPAPSPNQARMQADVPPDPRDPDFKNSRGRNILNAIGAGLAGAANPKLGYEIGQDAKNAKYNAAKKSYDVRHGKDIEQEGIESKGRSEEIEKARLGTSRGIAQAGADTRQEQADTAAAREKDYKSVTEGLTAERDARQKQIEEMTAKEKAREADFQKYQSETDTVKKAQALKDYEAKWHNTSRESGDEKAADAVKKQSEIDRYQATPKGKEGINTRNVTRITAADDPKAIKTARDLAKAKKEGEIAGETTPESIEGQKKLTAAKDSIKQSANSKMASEKAKVALQRFPDIESQLSEASDNLFGNRFQDFLAGKLGKGAAEFEPLRLNIGLMQSLVAQIHVQRTGAVILNKFEGLFNAKEMDKETLTAGLKEVKKWLLAYAQNPNDPSLDTKVPENVTPKGVNYEFK